jgi:hypothetical protein
MLAARGPGAVARVIAVALLQFNSGREAAGALLFVEASAT